MFYKFCQIILYLIFKPWNRFTLRGGENLDHLKSGFILASNHVSYLDPPVLGSIIRRPLFFLANEKLFAIPVLKHLIRWLNALPVAGESDFKSLRVVIRALKNARPVIIFPQGTRVPTHEKFEAQPGVAFLAYASNSPIVPCYIDGTDRAWPKGARWIKPYKITVRLGEPIFPDKKGSQGIARDQLYSDMIGRVTDKILELKSLATSQGKGKKS